MTGIRRVAALSRQDWRLLGSAITLVLGIRAALWLLPSRIIIARVRRVAARAPRANSSAPDATRIVWAVAASARRVPGASCLTQALAVQLLLLRHGYEAELCVGVTRGAAGEFRAHAWVERAGRIVIGGDGSRVFTRLPDLAEGGFAPSAGGRR